MADVTVREPLLTIGAAKETAERCMPLSLCLLKWALKLLMWGILVAWVALIFIFPSQSLKWVFSSLISATEGTIFGVTGSIFLAFSAPVLIISLLAYVYIILFFNDDYKTTTSFPRFRLWTFPVLVDGPFGVVSAAELIGILLFAAYIIWAMTTYTIQSATVISKFSLPMELQSSVMLEFIGLRLGTVGIFCLAFLFLPVARGSVLLRLIDIPFEHATRYHVWLGHLTMVLFTLHGAFYMIAWTIQGRLIEKMVEWKNIGVANLPGVISLLAGLLMWFTSFHTVRKKYFELFFYTHQLYVIFVVFLALHVGDFIFSISAAGIFLFILDRFLRFCQSRPTVDVISASTLPCGTVELVFSKPATLKYNALSFIFLQLRELSFLQWHPFSVSSSPLDGENHIAVLIKVLGGWTAKLRDTISYIPEKQKGAIQSSKITASVEGPYGHEQAYHLTYENLILVAGGIGISPFLAILSDVFHRIEEQKACLPKNILVIWAVKKSPELSLISAINVQAISPSIFKKLHLDIQAFVTQESDPALEEGKLFQARGCSFTPKIGGKSMSSLVGTGNNIFSGAYFAVSTFGFITLYGLLEVMYIEKYGSSWWFKGLLFSLCMVVSVVIFGGIVIFLWNFWEKEKISQKESVASEEKGSMNLDNNPVLHNNLLNIADYMTIRYGHRPNFRDIFNSYSQRMGHVNVGVLICGPPALQSSVANECRFQNIRGRWNQPIFHFHSHSFDL